MDASSFEQRFWREREARKEAERILELKSIELYESNQALKQLAEGLEKQVAERTLEAEQERNRAIALTKAKSEFVAAMSHEIRTPINGIIGALHLLANQVTTPESKRLLELADHAASVLLHTVNDILDFSKIEAGQVVTESIPYDLHRLCRLAVESFEKQCHNKGLSIRLEWGDPLPKWQTGDPFRVTQILNNYLSNAVKFTRSGGIVLSAQPSEDRIVLSVKDTGIGISSEGLSKLFLDFSQVDASTTREYGGTGLGLVISKKVAHLIGAEVGVSSTPGQGSDFWVSLPNRATQAQVPAATLDKPQANHTPCDILLVEDNPINREIEQKILQQLGHHVDVARNGVEAIAKIKDRSHPDHANGPKLYDLVLMDCQMPEMDGFEAAQQILAISPHTPIIALTANTSADDKERALSSGMTAFLSKPFRISEVSNLIAQHRRTQ